jgi:hypothetical protein
MGGVGHDGGCALAGELNAPLVRQRRMCKRGALLASSASIVSHNSSCPPKAQPTGPMAVDHTRQAVHRRLLLDWG